MAIKRATFQLLILSMFFATLSCSPTKYTSNTNTIDSERREVSKTSIERDSVYVYFSDTVKIVQKGDTVYQDVVRWRTQTKTLIMHDTVRITDTVRVVVNRDIVKTEVKRVPIWQKISMVGIMAINLILLCLLIKKLL